MSWIIKALAATIKRPVSPLLFVCMTSNLLKNASSIMPWQDAFCILSLQRCLCCGQWHYNIRATIWHLSLPAGHSILPVGLDSLIPQETGAPLPLSVPTLNSSYVHIIPLHTAYSWTPPSIKIPVGVGSRCQIFPWAQKTDGTEKVTCTWMQKWKYMNGHFDVVVCHCGSKFSSLGSTVLSHVL